MAWRALLAAALVLGIGTASAQTVPHGGIALIIPFPVGGPTDAVGRLLAEAMGRELRASVVTENMGGGGGTIGAARVAQARPDGQVLLLHNIGMATTATLYRRLPYDALASFEPLGLVTATPMVWVARPNFPGETLADMLAHIRARGDRVNLANAGLGSASQLCGTLLQAGLGVRMTTITFRGSGQVYPDLLGGRVDLYCDQTTSAVPLIQARSVKGFAVTSTARLAVIPDVPTAGEAGLPGFEIAIWHGLYAPRGTPRPVVERLNLALRAALRDPRVVTRLNELGSPPEPVERQDPAVHRAYLAAEIARWRPILQAAGEFAD